ncbi:hypothetical protein D3875_15475 [Deinococcus cavernae]|uniref:Uncharacterized protein n=1 Tax=Deinococcus cavernae TaxID=2320857 RepID=A0A418V9E1_9DEIO|nr:hypothetical protein [Deinococcus cavernae]RJF72731.1 hypothetical protein D3875_15475 [Deinococcus cavernae]
MFRRRLEEAATWLRSQGENLELNERDYKVPGAREVHRLLHDFLEGKTEGKVNVQPPRHLNLLGWQILDGLNKVANERPEIFRAALSAIWSTPLDPRNADLFWSTLDPALDVLGDTQRKHFNGEGTRASVASYFLFLADPEHQPFYRPNFGGRAIGWLYDRKDGLDSRTLGSLLADYTGRCHYLKGEFDDLGVPLQDMIDVQSALYILADQYLKISRPRKRAED